MKRSLRRLLLLLVLAAGSLVWLQQEGQTGAGGTAAEPPSRAAC